MRPAHARVATIAFALVLILPTTALLTPGARAAGTGTLIAGDAAGDHTGGGLGADLLRLGGINDANAIHFFVLVADASDISPTGLDYFISFHTGPTGTGSQVTGCDFFAHIQVLTPGTVANADVDTVYNNPVINAAGPNPTGCFSGLQDGALGAKTEHAAWVGNELRFDLPRADIFGDAATDAPMSALSVSVQDDGPTASSYDGTDVADSYAMPNTPVASTIPDAPASLLATAASSSAISLAWAAPASDGGSAITSYHVQRATASGAEAAYADAGLALAFTDSAVSAGTTYFYTVTAVNAVGESATSVETSVVAADPTLPGAPTSLVATGGNDRITLAWSAPVDTGNLAISSYQIYRDGSAYATSGATGYVDAAPGTVARSYKVAAVNGLGEGPQSAAASATATVGPKFKAYADPDAANRAEGIGSAVGFLVATAGEPSLGVNQQTGDVLLQVDRLTLKLHPDGASGVWTDVTNPTQASLPLSDPIGWLDPATNRYFGGTIVGDCSQIAYTEDMGSSWTPTTGACDSFNGHDHETIGGGPFPPGIPHATYPNAIWYCAQDNLVSKCAMSADGGISFLPSEVIYNGIVQGGPTGAGVCIGIHGHVRVAPNGTAVVPTKQCGVNLDKKGGAITYDGIHWNVFQIPGSSVRAGGEFDPSASFGADGTLYYGYCDGDSHAKMAVSRDGAATWATPVDVGAALGVKNCEFPEVIAGDGDRAAIAFLGSTTAGSDQDASFAGVWHMYIALTYDHGATWTTIDATPNDPVQRGCISAAGTLGGACSQRNLLDFNDIALDGQGNVYVGYADGCVGACVTGSGPSTSAVGSVLVQTGGDCLFAGKCSHAFDPPGPTTSLLPHADTCNPNVVFFSRNANQPASFDHHTSACNAEQIAGFSPADTRVITPGADRVQLRYTIDVAGADHLVARFNGLGASTAPVTMAKTTSALGAVTYDSPQVAINNLASGSIIGTISKPDGTLIASVTFHTAT